MQITTLTPPGGEPLSLADAKAFARIGSDLEDTLINDLIAAARARLEAMTGMALMSRTLRLTLSEWPLGVLDQGALRLPKRPALALVSVRLTDGDGLDEDVSEAFTLETGLTPRLKPAPGQGWVWPRSIHQWLEIDWQAGFGSADDIPEDLVHAMKIIVAHEFENRDASDYRAQDRLRDRLRDALSAWQAVSL